MSKNELKATTAIRYDGTKPRKDGKFAVFLRVTFDRKPKNYQTGVYLTEDEFKLVHADRKKEPYKSIGLKLNDFENKAREIIEEIPFFSFEAFEKKYYSNRGARDSVKYAFEKKIEELSENEQIGTAESYKTAMNSICNFFPDARFVDITPIKLEKYERTMLSNNKSVSTIGIYLRPLRAIYNSAIKDGYITKDLYPFGVGKYEIPTSKNVKKALKMVDIENLFYHSLEEGSMMEKARDMWLFIYLANGINVKDLCLLQYKNISDNTIQFYRAKTLRTKKIKEKIVILITDEIKTIIEKWGNKDKNPENYIFPVLTKGLSITEIRGKTKQFTKMLNSYTKELGEDLGFKMKLTSYSARHSFASVLANSNKPLDFIRTSLGQSDLKTTISYIKSIETEDHAEHIEALTPFKNKRTLAGATASIV